ncbi:MULTISPECIES: fibronectin type III domain-containing protein [unclassified Streptomyces]|uniref:fibronectin type III domain-containing protein n=1 Tax=unclassified Streptomyces TaxID=2593676 RepID=UPI001F34311B|nr:MULTISPECIES: fibronectin type III domain-containing protein [unclassified Streptomyces]WKX22658.1 fibronectin type III domain-containing protein [Streptomyces sp. HUAS CX7]
MRDVPVAALARRCALLCGALVLLTSCGWGADGDDADGGGLPGVPTGVTAQAGSATTVHVMWNAVEDVETYEVYRGGTMVREVPAAERMVDVTRLRPSTAYSFTVRARDADGRLGPRSREVRATTPAAVADESAPTRPGDVRGRAVGSRAVQLGWSAAKDDRGVVSYDVYQGDAKVHSVGGGQTAAVVTGLRPGTRYAFTVRARDAADNISPASAVVRLTTGGTDDGRATAPTQLRAASHRADGAYYLDLSWVPPRTDGPVTEYQIHLDGRAATSLVYGADAPRDRAEYSFYAGREAGVTHRVRIRARLADGTWGGFSAERKVTTGAGR